jgi:protein phosphatase
MASSAEATNPVPVARRFTVLGDKPGPRCGHTLTATLGSKSDLSTAKLVMFGGATALEGTYFGAYTTGRDH